MILPSVHFARDDILERLPLPPTAQWPGGVWDVEVLRSEHCLLEIAAWVVFVGPTPAAVGDGDR